VRELATLITIGRTRLTIVVSKVALHEKKGNPTSLQNFLMHERKLLTTCFEALALTQKEPDIPTSPPPRAFYKKLVKQRMATESGKPINQSQLNPNQWDQSTRGKPCISTPPPAFVFWLYGEPDSNFSLLFPRIWDHAEILDYYYY
jgi:hypothetical protein